MIFNDNQLTLMIVIDGRLFRRLEKGRSTSFFSDVLR